MQKIRILLAEDHQTIRAGLKLIVNAQPDMQVVGEAGDGNGAVQLARALHPHVVVMDVSMPQMNGLAATERLTSVCPDVKVLTLTRYSEDSYVQQLLRAGAFGYVLKQSQPAVLLTGIRTVAAGRKFLDPAVTGRFIKQAVGPAPAAGDLESLTSREEEVLRLVAWGYSNKEIASRLDVSVKTVETHKANAMAKLALRSRIDVVRFALMRGWLQDT